MNPCLICLEKTNNLFKNANCKCKYNVHKLCLNNWSNHCIICKAPIINKQNHWFFNVVEKRTTEWIIAPIIQIMFVPIFIIYICFMNAVYLLNVYVLESYDNIGR